MEVRGDVTLAAVCVWGGALGLEVGRTLARDSPTVFF